MSKISSASMTANASACPPSTWKVTTVPPPVIYQPAPTVVYRPAPVTYAASVPAEHQEAFREDAAGRGAVRQGHAGGDGTPLGRDALQADELVCTALGSTLTQEFLRLKRAEVDAYRHQVSDWELRRYAQAF